MNKRKMFLWMLPALAFTAVVFAGHGAVPTSQPPLPGSLAPGRHEIVRLVSRGHAITVASTPRGPLYSATAGDGTILAADLSLDELRLQEPALFREISPATATSEDGIGAIGVIDTAE